MSVNWTEDDVTDANPLEPEQQGDGLVAVVWMLFFALLGAIVALSAVGGAVLGG